MAQRELLILCALATLGDTSAQLGPHRRACLQVGNAKAVVVPALVHCFPYIGFLRAVAAIRSVKDLWSLRRCAEFWRESPTAPLEALTGGAVLRRRSQGRTAEVAEYSASPAVG